MATITTSERLLLDNIARNQYTDGQLGPNVLVWSDCLDFGPQQIAKTSIPGILASLINKGLALSDGEVTALTEEGYEMWKQEWLDKEAE